MALFLFDNYAVWEKLLTFLLVFLIVLGAAYWLVMNLAPAQFQKWIFGVVLVIGVIVLLKFAGHGLSFQ